MIGDLVRSFAAGRRATKAWQLIIQVTGRAPDEIYKKLLMESADRFSVNELALFHMIIYCSDTHDLLGRLTETVVPEVRDRILDFYDVCISKGLIRSAYLKEEYSQIKLDVAKQKQVTVAPADTNQSSHVETRDTHRSEPIYPADIRKPTASSSATIESSSGYSDNPVIRPTFRPPPLERLTIKSTVAENKKQETSNVSSLANARLSGINNTELQRMTFSSLLAAGTSGDPEAQFALGVKYEIGDGVEDNCVEAARWYLKSAKQGYGRAQFNLALCYESGLGVNLDWKKAAELFILAANAGVEEAPKRSALLALKVAQQEQLKNIGQ
jgi:hypothetical protein